MGTRQELDTFPQAIQYGLYGKGIANQSKSSLASQSFPDPFPDVGINMPFDNLPSLEK